MTHVVVGAGPVGSGVANLLADQGHEVRVVTRSGSGPRRDGVELVRADAADAEALRIAAKGAVTVYNCVNPAYHRWARDWPPVATALVEAARAADAAVVAMGNLYVYGRVDAPMTEDTPIRPNGVKGQVRAAMWRQLVDSGLRVTEARAADFYGPGATNHSLLGTAVTPRVMRGRTAWVFGGLDQPHSWGYLPDVAGVLATLGTQRPGSVAWGRPWHVPSAPPRSIRQMARALADAAGAPEPTVRAMPRAVRRALGLAVPFRREWDEVEHQTLAPFVVDATAFTREFGVTATPVEQAAAETVAWWRARA